MYQPCDASRLESLLKTVKMINRSDLERLIRLPEQKLLDLWNRVRRNEDEYLENCSFDLEPEIDSNIRGEYQLAQLLIAAALKSKGREVPGITDQFKDKEYEIIHDFEKYKIFDRLSIDEIVKYIERREGKVYEFIKEYYAKQYNALDQAWGELLRDMMYAIEERYKRRREKMEQAVLAYIRKRGLENTLFEIEEVVMKIKDSHRIRNEALEESKIIDEIESRIEKKLEELREKIIASTKREDLEQAINQYRALEEELGKYAESLNNILRKLGVKQDEFKKLAVSGNVKEIINSELSLLENTITELSKRLNEYNATIESIKLEKQALEERVKELEETIKGIEKGTIVTTDEALSLAEIYLTRLYTKFNEEIQIYNPLEDEIIKISGWDAGGFTYSGKYKNGLFMVRKKGLFNKRDYLKIEVAVILHNEAYEKQGYDQKRVGLGEILTLVSRKLHESITGDYYHILVIASPTGFTSKALSFIRDESYARRFYTKNLTVYLVDLLTGNIYYNDVDKAAVSNKKIIEPEYPEESFKKVIDYITSEEALIEANTRGQPPFLPLNYIIEKTNISEEYVRAALERLAEKGVGRVSRLSSGEIVFVYKQA